MPSPEDLKFTVTSEVGRVSAMLVRPADSVALLVLAHGAGTDMRHRSLETLSAALAEQKLATLRYNFPYMEHDRGRISPKPVLTATVRAAVNAAAEAAPELPLFAGGRSMGGRMTSLAASQAPLPGVWGLVFFAFPLHPAGKPGTERGEHLFEVNIPMLFLQGPRDDLATPELLAPIIKRLGQRATLHTVAGADHSFKVLKSSGRTDAAVLRELVETTVGWISTKL